MDLQQLQNMNGFFYHTMYSLLPHSYARHSNTALPLNLLARDFLFQILAHPVFKMRVIRKPNKVALSNKRHFEEKKMEIIQHV